MSLSAFAASGRFYRGNLHTHSNRSDGTLPPEEVCRRYRERGYDFICISDHFLERYGYPVTDTLSLRSEGFTTILGAELHAPATEAGELWHILAVGLPADFAPTEAAETGPMLARRARAAGAFVAIAHPEWYGLSLQDGLSIDAAHAVEVYNHTSAEHTSRGGGSYYLDALLNAGCRLGALACDDAHFNFPGQTDRDAFGGWVMVKAEDNDPQTLVQALIAGHYYATRGPSIFRMDIIDGQFLIETSPAKQIALVGPNSKSVYVSGEDLTNAQIPVKEIKGDWCRLVVVDRGDLCAWSNPIWTSTLLPS